MKNESFTVCYSPRQMNGRQGFDWTIRDSQRRFRGEGWSAGRKVNAEVDAREAIAKLQASTNNSSAAAS